MDKLTIEKEIASLAIEIKNATENTQTSDLTQISRTVEQAAELFKKTVLWEHICNNTTNLVKSEIIEKTIEPESPIEMIPTVEEPAQETQEANTVTIETSITPIEAQILETEIPKPEPEPSIINNISVTDIKKHIGFNDKFEFINELFRGNSNNYEIAVTKINSAPSAKEALKTFTNFKIANGWADDNESALKFQEIIQIAFK